MTRLNIKDIWCINGEILKNEALLFFKKLVHSNDQCIPLSLKLQNVPKISNSLHDLLLQSVSVSKVKEALL